MEDIAMKVKKADEMADIWEESGQFERGYLEGAIQTALVLSRKQGDGDNDPEKRAG